MTEISIVTLVALLVSSNVFWMTVCLKLTNRIMSKNYAELVQADYRPKQAPPSPADDMSDPIAEQHAKDANTFLGLIS